MSLHILLPKIRTIGDELTLSLTKNLHFSFLPSHFRLSLLKAGPLDLSFWSFLTFLHHGIEEVERHFL